MGAPAIPTPRQTERHTSHGKPVARIVPVDQPTKLEQLRAAGLVREPHRSKRVAPAPLQTAGTVSEAIQLHLRRAVGHRRRRGDEPASAVAVSDVDMDAAAGDRRLLDAWHDLGLATVDVTR